MWTTGYIAQWISSDCSPVSKSVIRMSTEVAQDKIHEYSFQTISL